MVFYLTDEEDNIELLRYKIQKVYLMLLEVQNPEEILQPDEVMQSVPKESLLEDDMNSGVFSN